MDDVEGYGYLAENFGGFLGGFFGQLLGSLIILIFIIWSIIIIVAITSYIFKSFALYKMSKNNNYKYKWLSWIPLFNNGVLTKLAFNDYTIGLVMPVCLLGLTMLGNFNSMIDILGKILLLIYLILYLFSAYKIYKKYTKHYIVLTIFSILSLGLTVPFMLFAIRKNN